MKTSILIGTVLLISAFANAEIRSTKCSEKNGKIKLVVKENLKDRNHSAGTGKIVIRSSDFMQPKEFKIKEANETMMYHVLLAQLIHPLSIRMQDIELKINKDRSVLNWNTGVQIRTIDLNCN